MNENLIPDTEMLLGKMELRLLKLETFKAKVENIILQLTDHDTFWASREPTAKRLLNELADEIREARGDG